MPSLPEAIISVLSLFASLFSKPVWGHVQVLLTGAILCQGPHTVAAILRVMGLAGIVAMAASRPASRWYALLLAATASLAWNPRTWADPGADL